MSIRVVDRVDGWDQRPFSGGFDALQDLADEEFSGVVRAGGAELYMTVGTVIAVERGTIDDFDETSGTVFTAPVPALPLLAVMQAQDVDVRAQYYTEETPISEVNQTLTSGGFTGYVELSENVLSGDYFLVYHGGNSMSVAFVGNNDQLLTDDEAFQTADDEVGIYKVRQVDVDPIEIPEPAGSDAGSEDAANATAPAATEDEGATDETPDDTDEGEVGDEGDVGGPADDGDESATDSAAAAADDETATAAAAEDPSDASRTTKTKTADASAATSDDATNPSSTATETDTGTASTAREAQPDTRDRATGNGDDAVATQETSSTSRTATSERASTERAESTETAASSTESTNRTRRDDAGGTRSASREATTTDAPREGRTDGQRAQRETPSRGQGGGGGTSSRTEPRQSGSGGATSEPQAGDLETRSIPSLDPGKTQTPTRQSTSPPTPEPQQSRQPATGQDGRSAGGNGADAAGARQESRQAEQASDARATAGGAAEPEPEPQQPDPEPEQATPDSDTLEELESELADREAEIERLEGQLEDAHQSRDDLKADLEAVREERDELAEQVDRLEEELQRLEEEFGAATDAETRMTPSEAIEGTNLFVEYDSKGDATLGDAHGGSNSREEVGENLRLGVHTEFDDRTVAVGGQSFEEFLQGTLHYRFAQWVVGDLLFEIRDTGHADSLPDLYDAIPEIRRVEFNGAVDVEYVEDGQEKGGRERFDVIFRHRMGDPLLVANLNDARDPATGGMMESLVTSAERVGQTEDELASAFLVTSSFFESEALETVSQATKGGLLSRDSRKSFVNLSRKEGYHLCLVAARDRNFHMEVPEL